MARVIRLVWVMGLLALAAPAAATPCSNPHLNVFVFGPATLGVPLEGTNVPVGEIDSVSIMADSFGPGGVEVYVALINGPNSDARNIRIIDGIFLRGAPLKFQTTFATPLRINPGDRLLAVAYNLATFGLTFPELTGSAALWVTFWHRHPDGGC